LEDYLCYYVNDTHIYAFNSLGQLGFCPNSGYYDIALMVSGVYIHENITEVKKDSGIVKFGFYESTFFYAEYPRSEYNPLYLKRNVTIELARSNMTNDGIGNFTFNVTAKHWFHIDTTFRFDFCDEIRHAVLSRIAYNGNSSDEQIAQLIWEFGLVRNSPIFDLNWDYVNLPHSYDLKGPSLLITPYLLERLKYEFIRNISLIEENETMVFEINATVENYRSFKPMKINFYMTNWTFKTIFQKERKAMNLLILCLNICII
jgi:hypothetical protein